MAGHTQSYCDTFSVCTAQAGAVTTDARVTSCFRNVSFLCFLLNYPWLNFDNNHKGKPSFPLFTFRIGEHLSCKFS